MPHDVQAGGYSQRNYQQRKAEETKHFLKDFAEELSHFVERHAPEGLVLLGTDENLPAVRRELVRRRRSFVVPATIFFLTFYMGFILLTGYAVGSMLAAGLSLAMYLSGAALRQIFSYLLGGFDTAIGGALKRQTNLSLSWERGRWSAGWNSRFISSYRAYGAAGGPLSQTAAPARDHQSLRMTLPA